MFAILSFNCYRTQFITNVSVDVSPSVAPTIKEGSQTASVHINKPAVLECIVSGVPPPRVTWRKHGAILAGNNPR